MLAVMFDLSLKHFLTRKMMRTAEKFSLKLQNELHRSMCIPFEFFCAVISYFIFFWFVIGCSKLCDYKPKTLLSGTNQNGGITCDFKKDIIKVKNVLKIKKLDQNCFFQEYLLSVRKFIYCIVYSP